MDARAFFIDKSFAVSFRMFISRRLGYLKWELKIAPANPFVFNCFQLLFGMFNTAERPCEKASRQIEAVSAFWVQFLANIERIELWVLTEDEREPSVISDSIKKLFKANNLKLCSQKFFKTSQKFKNELQVKISNYNKFTMTDSTRRKPVYVIARKKLICP